MTRWQITPLSTKDSGGTYIDQFVAAEESAEWYFDAIEPITGATVELWRITRDGERRSPSSPQEELVVDGAECVVLSPYLWVTATGLARHETYRLVIVFEGVQNGDWARTRHLEVVG